MAEGVAEALEERRMKAGRCVGTRVLHFKEKIRVGLFLRWIFFITSFTLTVAHAHYRKFGKYRKV